MRFQNESLVRTSSKKIQNYAPFDSYREPFSMRKKMFLATGV
ncbi:hypothetical protein LEP1GSC161_0781 [Leptospira santarosai str. CBC1416]|uniref:Uncharacterized protein n=1 Tax=Leptospira santarosai str. CBC1416 TaxID=1193059 RepID=M6VSN5_9LEPT|nr:hypothetical protein LEP1GSC005_1765 [Leptospira santarosai str. ST188]EMO32290.1 hypothetical protein LEP1GSC175_0648 [Leptospira santarosai str. HAI821]EMO58096.1 hypothetical protein LEP1GSC161_0781 [Leptospira santarosai str. CBC1416]EMO72346.1 hypothetical protein LEP1GSC130_1955 [Leptospira santarosai str. 200403458]EMO98078.1 hypothetical protein LEP1GSC120_0898 [Leptospira santarosai str. 200702252]